MSDEVHTPTQAETGEKNIVITGFMGTGKTTVGRRVAELTNRPFIDTDDEIVKREGKTIPQIFLEDGEFVFRAKERQLCVELAAQRGLVIATGGGMLVDEGNRALMLASGFVVCLDAAPETIARRLAHTTNRPLAQNWQQVLEKRRAIYAQIPIHVYTTDRTPDDVAQEIVRLWHSA
jgi:shikimate kinase